MYRKFRAYIWERYQIDVLRRRSLAGTGCEIFLRHYFKASPAPAPLAEPDSSCARVTRMAGFRYGRFELDLQRPA